MLLSPDSATVHVDREASLVALVSGTSDARVIWRSSDPATVLVDSVGTVRGVAPGMGLVTATLVVGRGADTARVTVLPPVQVVLSPAAETLAVGSVARLQATLTGAADGRVRWTSSAAAVARVDSTGAVTAVSPGQAVMTAISLEDTLSRGSAVVHIPDRMLSAVAGDAQVGLVASALADSLVVRVTNVAGTPVAGERVVWSSTGGGTLQPAEAVSDPAGIIRARWVLPAGAGPDTAIAGIAGLRFRFTARAKTAPTLGLNYFADFWAGRPDPRFFISVRGAVRAVMLFVHDNPSTPTITTDSAYRALVPAALPAFAEYSYGRMSLQVEPLSRWIRVPRTQQEYPDFGVFMADVLAQTDSAVDYSKYAQVWLVFSPTSAPCSSGSMTGNIGYSTIRADGKSLDSFVVLCPQVFEGGYSAPAYVVHEAPHSWGLWDLYDITSPNLFAKVGSWDPMSDMTMRHFTAFDKLWLGWLDPGEVKAISEGGVEEVISPIEREGGVKLLAAKLDTVSAVYAEVREPIGRDAGICRAGVLLYVADAGKGSAHGLLTVLPAAPDQEQYSPCGYLYNAPFGPGGAYEDPQHRFSMQVLGQTAEGYRVRLRKR